MPLSAFPSGCGSWCGWKSWRDSDRDAALRITHLSFCDREQGTVRSGIRTHVRGVWTRCFTTWLSFKCGGCLFSVQDTFLCIRESNPPFPRLTAGCFPVKLMHRKCCCLCLCKARISSYGYKSYALLLFVLLSAPTLYDPFPGFSWKKSCELSVSGEFAAFFIFQQGFSANCRSSRSRIWAIMLSGSITFSTGPKDRMRIRISVSSPFLYHSVTR